MKWFDKQSDAIEACEKLGNQMGVFVLHKFSGRRRFCVTTYEEFTGVYLDYHLDLCHYYEIIRAGAPCRLYFDIDVSLGGGVEVDGPSLVEIFIRFVNQCLLVEFKRHIEDRQVLIMDSTSSTKFSQHIIYPETIFRSNEDCGNFVRKLAAAAADAVLTGTTAEMVRGFPISDLERLYVEQPNGRGLNIIADLCVYSRNRHFRIYRSSKLDREEHLVVAKENLYPLLSQEQFFNDSLVVYPAGPSSDQQLTCAPMEQSPKKNIPGKEKKPANISQTHKYLDDFVLSEIQKMQHFKDSVIADILHSTSGMCVAYFVKGSRWCQHVNREHSSNRPYFCANMKFGTLYQMCHSSGCRGYRSNPIRIPDLIWAKFQIGDEEELLQQLIATDDIADGV